MINVTLHIHAIPHYVFNIYVDSNLVHSSTDFEGSCEVLIALSTALDKLSIAHEITYNYDGNPISLQQFTNNLKHFRFPSFYGLTL